MARMIPSNPPDFHNSKGEERLFQALRTLPDEIVVIHSFRWVHPGNARALTRNLKAQGEGDFVLFDPSKGVLVVEVKGGDIWCEQGEWHQRNRKTKEVRIIFPEAQASNTMHRIRTEIISKIGDARKILFCHAVWFPDGEIDRNLLPMNFHPDMTLDKRDMVQPANAIQRTFEYWNSCFPGRKKAGTELFRQVLENLAPTLSMVQSVRQTLDEREIQFIQLTRDQARIIHFLDEQDQAVIIGAAGTGKTLLAIEKARRLASPIDPVLFLCFNSALHKHLAENHALANVKFMTFHGLAREVMGPEGTLDDAVQGLLECLVDELPFPYKHLIIDEGQDFHQEWLEYLQLRFREGTFYVFYDRHQTIQGEQNTDWLDKIPCRLILTSNCRNTNAIARVAYRAARLNLVPNIGIDGPRPVLHCAENNDESIKIAQSIIRAACKEHKTPPHEIVVLTMDILNESSPWHLDQLGGEQTADSPKANHVTVTTVRKFKGLEAMLVIIVDLDFSQAVNNEWWNRLYVACSRARHAVHLLTNSPESVLGEAVRTLTRSDKIRPSWRSLSKRLGVRLGGTDIDPFN